MFRKMIFTAAAMITLGVVAVPTDASAYWRSGGWHGGWHGGGWGYYGGGFAAGAILGGLLAAPYYYGPPPGYYYVKSDHFNEGGSPRSLGIIGFEPLHTVAVV